VIATIKDIQENFGEEVAGLVDGLTKISKIPLRSPEEGQAENFRKMILAMVKDIRVILIKLSDRLHNMRTLQYHSADKQAEIAQETLDIYAPVANRLGID
jgi:GTP pyrophosphokinase